MKLFLGAWHQFLMVSTPHPLQSETKVALGLHD